MLNSRSTKKEVIETDSFVKNSIDTAQYVGLPYYDSTLSHNGGIGYLDIFTINNHQFRIVHRDTMFDGVVEAYRNGHWYRMMDFWNLGNHNDYDIY